MLRARGVDARRFAHNACRCHCVGADRRAGRAKRTSIFAPCRRSERLTGELEPSGGHGWYILRWLSRRQRETSFVSCPALGIGAWSRRQAVTICSGSCDLPGLRPVRALATTPSSGIRASHQRSPLARRPARQQGKRSFRDSGSARMLIFSRSSATSRRNSWIPGTGRRPRTAFYDGGAAGSDSPAGWQRGQVCKDGVSGEFLARRIRDGFSVIRILLSARARVSEPERPTLHTWPRCHSREELAVGPRPWVRGRGPPRRLYETRRA